MRKAILVVIIGIFSFCFCAWSLDKGSGSDKIYTSKNKFFSVIKPDIPDTQIEEGINTGGEIEWVEFHLGSLHWSAIGLYWINYIKDVRKAYNIPADITFMEIADFLIQQDIERNNLSDFKKIDEGELKISGHKAKQIVGRAIRDKIPALVAFTAIEFGKNVAIGFLLCPWDENIDDFKKLYVWEGYGLLLNSINNTKSNNSILIPKLLKGKIEDGIYHAADGTFEISVPFEDYNEMEVKEGYTNMATYVSFLNKVDYPNEFYRVTIFKGIDESRPWPTVPFNEAIDGVLVEYKQQAESYGSSPIERQRINTTIDGKKAVLVTLSQTIPWQGKVSGSTVYHILYIVKFVKDGAMISVQWPFSCEACINGLEEDILSTDERIEEFVKSFKFSPDNQK